MKTISRQPHQPGHKLGNCTPGHTQNTRTNLEKFTNLPYRKSSLWTKKPLGRRGRLAVLWLVLVEVAVKLFVKKFVQEKYAHLILLPSSIPRLLHCGFQACWETTGTGLVNFCHMVTGTAAISNRFLRFNALWAHHHARDVFVPSSKVPMISFTCLRIDFIPLFIFVQQQLSVHGLGLLQWTLENLSRDCFMTVYRLRRRHDDPVTSPPRRQPERRSYQLGPLPGRRRINTTEPLFETLHNKFGFLLFGTSLVQNI